MKRKVYLEGEIGEKFGKEFDIVAKSFSDVFRCLNGNFPEMQKYLIECDEKGIGFTCEVAGTPIVDEKELWLQYPEGSMVVSAVPAGSKSGGAKILAAIALTVLILYPPTGLYVSPAAATQAGTAAGLTTAGQIVAGIAVNLALTGFAQIMAPDPSIDNAQDESYLFQGTGQTALEGDPVPVVYGRLRIPGRPISFDVRNKYQNFYSVNAVNKAEPAEQIEEINNVSTDTNLNFPTYSPPPGSNPAQPIAPTLPPSPDRTRPVAGGQTISYSGVVPNLNFSLNFGS